MKVILTTKQEHEVKAGDVFTVSFKDLNQRDFHCFEGLLIASDLDNELVLLDTYWSEFGGNGGHLYKIDKAIEKFDISFIASINDFDLQQPISGDPYKSYLKNDILYMHRQHACSSNCKYFYLRKGAKKSKVIMLHQLDKMLEEKRNKKLSIDIDINYINRQIQDIHNGLEVYI